jgi:hypothetical protein
MSRLIPWQPVPAPTSVPSGTLVPQLCGHPEQKNGVRWVASGSSEPTWIRCRGGGESRSASRRTSRERSASTMASGVHQAVLVEQLGAGLVVLADHAGPLGGVVEHLLDQALQGRVLLLDDDDLVQAAGEAPDHLPVERHGHAQLQQPDPRRGDLGVGAQAEPAQGLARLVVRVAGGDDADPRRPRGRRRCG